MGISDGETDYMSSFNASDYYNRDAFADIGNLDHCMKYLNQTLVTFGFPAPLNLLSTDPTSVVRTCNCIYEILQQRQRDIEFREACNEQRQRLLSDMSRLEAKVERLDSQLSAKERELSALTAREQKAASAWKTQLEKLQQERDEFQRMVIGSQQVRTQQSHELKKKEKDYIKLQERLNQVLAEKKKDSKSGMEIMNLLQKEGRQRGLWNNSRKADGDFYKMIVDAYETKKQELMVENQDLRGLLRSMQVDMREFLNTPNGQIKQGTPLEPPSTPLGGRTDVFDLPFHMARDQIEQSLREKMSSIKERMILLQDVQRDSTVTPEPTERELELEAQLVEARSIIQEQASLMSRQMPKADDSRNYVSAHLEMEREAILASEGDRIALEERSNQLEAEREALRKMAMELDRERLDMDKTKRRLEEEQASWATTLKYWAPGKVPAQIPGKDSRGILEAFDEAQRSADNGFLRDENYSGDFTSSVRRYREPLISSIYQ